MKIAEIGLSLAGVFMVCGWCLEAAPLVVYRTGFETAEGFDARYTVDGQMGWTAEGTGGNGLYSEPTLFAGMGLQAYIGMFPPETPEPSLYLWQPINLAPVPTDTPVVKFSVDMAILDSLNTNYDDFCWTVFTTNVDHLLTIAFDNTEWKIYYLPERGASFIETGRSFENNVRYHLEIVMDFGRNFWSATLDGQALVPQQLITTNATPLNLGDIDAAWVYTKTNQPGDNLMVFDNYAITREGWPAPQLIMRGYTNENFSLQLSGEKGRVYAIEGSTDLKGWTALRTNMADLAEGKFSFTETNAPALRRFYRARLVQ